MTTNKLPPLPEPDAWLRVFDEHGEPIEEFSSSPKRPHGWNEDEIVAIYYGCSMREALRQSQSLPAGAVLERWGFPDHPREARTALIQRDDGYWTPWHIAQSALQADAREKGEAVDEKVIEQVAHAMHAAENKTSGWEWDDCSPTERDGWRELALAAIREIQSIGFATQPAQASEKDNG